jgi:hypothetical protein
MLFFIYYLFDNNANKKFTLFTNCLMCVFSFYKKRQGERELPCLVRRVSRTLLTDNPADETQNFDVFASFLSSFLDDFSNSHGVIFNELLAN